MRASVNWCIAVEHQRLSSIRIIFVNYQTSELQCNYQSYIQVLTIENTQDFSDIASIAPSRGFSSGTMTRVWLCYRRLSQIGVRTLLQKTESDRSISVKKTEYLNCCITAMRTCYGKDGLVDQMLVRQYYHGDIYSGHVDLVYDNSLQNRLGLVYYRLLV